MNLATQDGYSMTMNNYYETKPAAGCGSCLSHTASSFAGGKKASKKTTKKPSNKAPKKPSTKAPKKK